MFRVQSRTMMLAFTKVILPALKILTVDDNDIHRYSIARLLQSAGYYEAG
jgi:hypothetical protein